MESASGCEPYNVANLARRKAVNEVRRSVGSQTSDTAPWGPPLIPARRDVIPNGREGSWPVDPAKGLMQPRTRIRPRA